MYQFPGSVSPKSFRTATVGVLALFAFAAKTQGVDLVKIADVGDTPTGNTGPFVHFDLKSFNPPVMGPNGQVIFVGEDGTNEWGGSGIFVGSGEEVSVIVDETYNPPGLVGSLIRFSEIDVFGTTVAFRGSSADFRPGIFQFSTAGSPQGIAASFFDEVSNSTDRFNGMGAPSIGGRYRVFSGNTYENGSGPVRNGMFVGHTRMIKQGANPSGPVGPLRFFDHPKIVGDVVVFIGQDEVDYYSGIFRMGVTLRGSTPRELVGMDDVAPESFRKFTGFGGLDFTSGTIVFRGFLERNEEGFAEGIYTRSSAPDSSLPITKITSTDDYPPVGGFLDQFKRFGFVSIDGPIVVFTGYDNNNFGETANEGIYASSEGVVIKVVDMGDILDGKEIKSFVLGDSAINGTSVAFGVIFQDDSQAIYRADLQYDFNLSGATVYREYTDYGFMPISTIPGVFHLPDSISGSSYNYEAVTVSGTGGIVFDPEVAVGYEYTITGGDEGISFATFQAPPVGSDTDYRITLFEGGQPRVQETIKADEPIDLTGYGFPVSKFILDEIDPAATLDPEDFMAFPVLIGFTAAGEIDLQQTPLTNNFRGTTTGAYVKISASGQIGAEYRIESTDALPSDDWQPVGSMVLASAPQPVFDTSLLAGSRFYRATSVNSIATTTPASLSISHGVGILIFDAPGANYQVEYAPTADPENWQPLTSLTVTSSPHLYTVPNPQPDRKYRAVSEPNP